MADPEAGRQRLGLGRDQPVERRLAPGDHALGWLLAHHLARASSASSPALASACSFSMTCSGACTTTAPGGVVAGPPGPAGDLVELARLQQPGLRAVVLGQGGEDDGADRHVDADAEGVGAADDLEQAGLGERLHQPPVLGQHARRGARRCRAGPAGTASCRSPAANRKLADHVGDRVLFLAGAHVDAHQRLRLLERGGLGEVHHVDRRLRGSPAAPRASRAAG